MDEGFFLYVGAVLLDGDSIVLRNCSYQIVLMHSMKIHRVSVKGELLAAGIVYFQNGPTADSDERLVSLGVLSEEHFIAVLALCNISLLMF